jgi:DNA replication and repair protein RecF
MHLTRLGLENFRSYAAAALLPGPGLTVVTGPNGAGKTNLLEAAHVPITGRRHRAQSDLEMVRHGAPFARVTLELEGGPQAAATLELVLPGAEPPPGLRKRLTLNGVPRRAASVGEVARAVLFRPEEMMLLVGSPAERRRFMDAIAAQRGRALAHDLADLTRILAQRNALLRAIRAEEARIEGLAFWDEQLALVGARVMAARLKLVRELGERFGPLHDAVAPAAERGGQVQLSYRDALKEAWPTRADPLERIADVAELADALRARIASVREKEVWNGVSLAGPQRDDLGVTLDGRDVAAHASRGQQRTIILSLKLAETDALAADGPRPLVLLDDVFSELDPHRAERLAELLSDRGQVIVTSAHPDLPLPLSAVPVWRIADGRLEAPSA